MLTRQLDGPNLDGLLGEAAFFLGFEMDHASLGDDGGVGEEFGVSS
jgi:hypothetical protein